MVYQPHRYSRTSELFDQFVEVLKSVDVLLLTEVYPAGEMPIPGSTGFDLYERLRLEMGERAHWAESIAVARDHIASIIENNDILLTQGAGETATLAAELQARYHFKEPQVELVERGGA
jgi:UDP-N-acetylmuramate--alanine ligase